MTTLEITAEYDRRMKGRSPGDSGKVVDEICRAYRLDRKAVSQSAIDHIAGELGG